MQIGGGGVAALEDRVCEPVTEEDAAVAEVEADRAAGLPTIPFDDMKREYSI
jgi:hypothetical protein